MSFGLRFFNMKNIINTRILRNYKKADGRQPLQMLTCYDYQTAKLFDETEVDILLVGDSLGNVILGYDTTVSVTIEEMLIFASAVKRGAKNKFTVVDLPFGSYSTLEKGLESSIHLFQKSSAEAVKLEGAADYQLELIKRLTHIGIPVMGHIGLTPQSVHQMGGYFVHGKDEITREQLIKSAKDLQDAGCFSIVLECVQKDLAKQITDTIEIPTIGIGSGNDTDGQVLVINDLLQMGSEAPPSFCKPIANMYEIKKNHINEYLKQQRLL
jgi:3-methyl-2-oxobutanoate hydroxymethyltransferase